jgi:alcohol dehydrogenase YqhD (iron-dependent ADH family)
MTDDQKPLATILGLPPSASEASILATVTAWATERKQQRDNAAFEARLATLMRATNMP